MFPSSDLALEPWQNVRGLFIPLLNDVAFDLISTSTVSTYDEVK